MLLDQINMSIPPFSIRNPNDKNDGFSAKQWEVLDRIGESINLICKQIDPSVVLLLNDQIEELNANIKQIKENLTKIENEIYRN